MMASSLAVFALKFLREVHDVDAVRTERGPDRRRGGRLPRGNLELHHCLFVFSHVFYRGFGLGTRGSPCAHRNSQIPSSESRQL